MQITEVRLFVCDEPRLKATLSLTFGGAFVVKGVKIIDGRHGLFVAMPSRRTDGGFEDICHPVTPEYREYLELEVLRAYAEHTGQSLDDILARRRSPGEDPEDPPRSRRGAPRSSQPPPSSRTPRDPGRPERRPEGDRSGESDAHPRV